MESKTERPKNFSRALRSHLGYGDIKDLSAETKISTRNLYAYYGGECCPRWSIALELMDYFPASFATEALQDTGIIRVIKAGEGDPCSFKLTAGFGRMVGRLTEMLEDGRFDHMEELEIEGLLRGLQGRIDAWLSARAENNVIAIPFGGKVR